MISFLVLDYNRPDETAICLQSIRQNTKCAHQIILLSNGGEQSYVHSLYQTGWIDRLVLNKKNSGLGFGTTDLFKVCDTKYAIYFQNDQWLGREINAIRVSAWTHLIEYPESKVRSIGLAGDQCQGQYSERAHFIDVDFYNSIPNKPNGGAGPYHHIEWNEGYIQRYYRENGFVHHVLTEPLVGDNGCYALRENPDGSRWKHRTDTKQLWMLRAPKEKFIYPYFTDEEWAQVLSTQKWEDGKIPTNEVKSSFTFWK